MKRGTKVNLCQGVEFASLITPHPSPPGGGGKAERREGPETELIWVNEAILESLIGRLVVVKHPGINGAALVVRPIRRRPGQEV